MAEYPEKLAEILADFNFLTDPGERADYLIAFADRFEPAPARIATPPFPDEHRVPACESAVYVWVEQRPDCTLKLHFAVENSQGLSAKALAAILDESLSGLPPEAIEMISPEIVFQIFGSNVAMNRGQGLTSMVALVKHLARQYTHT